MKKRSVLAVLAGVVFIIVVTTIVDIVLHQLDVYPPWGEPMDDRLALLATVYRVLISIVGAWLTARLAPANPLRHALWLGYVGTVLGLIGLAVTSGKGLAPDWYPIALVVLAIPQCWAGGRLCEAWSGKHYSQAPQSA
jgi:hypothetical protein